MKLSDFTMQQINVALEGEAQTLGIWKAGSRGCLIGVGVKDGKKYQIKIHASEPRWYLVDDEIKRVAAELPNADIDEKDRLQSELDSLKRLKPDRDKRDAIADQYLEMRKKLMRALNSIGSPLVVANADVWKEKVEKRGNKTFAIEATPWVENVAVGLTEYDALAVKFSDLSTDKQYKIIASLADVLSKVHAKGILHSDLKIGNTLVVKEGGEFKAALLCVDSSFILEDLRSRKYPLEAWYYVIGGTYIAPELLGLITSVREEQDEDAFQNFDMSLVSEKADIFALGVTIYEYFYGRADGSKLMPFVGPDGDTLGVCEYGEAVNYGYKLALPKSTPKFLYGMLNWMLAKNPADRPTAAQVRDAFASADINAIPKFFLD